MRALAVGVHLKPPSDAVASLFFFFCFMLYACVCVSVWVCKRLAKAVAVLVYFLSRSQPSVFSLVLRYCRLDILFLPLFNFFRKFLGTKFLVTKLTSEVHFIILFLQAVFGVVCRLNGYHSIALERLFNFGFECKRIGRNVRPRIHEN